MNAHSKKRWCWSTWCGHANSDEGSNPEVALIFFLLLSNFFFIVIAPTRFLSWECCCPYLSLRLLLLLSTAGVSDTEIFLARHNMPQLENTQSVNGPEKTQFSKNRNWRFHTRFFWLHFHGSEPETCPLSKI